MSDESKTEQFLVYLEFDNEEVQEIKHKMEQAIETFRDCVYQLERLGVAKVRRKEKTANDK